MFSYLQAAIKNVLLYIFRLLYLMVKRLAFVAGPIKVKDWQGNEHEIQKGIPIEDQFDDITEVFRSTRLFFLFNLLALLVFIALPQGKDVILIVIEDLSGFQPGSLISLLFGVAGWSIISEFGARYKVYVTDNSGISLTDERVNFRKEVQRTVSIFYLLLPTLIVLISVCTVSARNITNWDTKYIWPFALIVILLVLTFAGLSRFYLDSGFIDKLRKKNVWYKVREEELKWIDKLYGIYNDHVLMVRKSENFVEKPTTEENKLKITYTRFIEILKALPFNKQPNREINESGFIESFPRDYIIEEELAPKSFTHVEYRPANYEANFKQEPFRWDEKKDGYYRWIYKNNPKFYRTLHLQVKVITISSLLIMLIISTQFLISYNFLGSPALVCLSFGCWLGLYTGLLYLDSRYRRKVRVSIRLLVFLVFLIVSYINLDHPVRMNHTYVNQDRPTLENHFVAWLTNHIKDTSQISWLTGNLQDCCCCNN